MVEHYPDPDWTFREKRPEDVTGASVGVTLRLLFDREKLSLDPTEYAPDLGEVIGAVIMLGDKELVVQGLALEIADLAIDHLDMVRDDDAIRIEVEEAEKNPPQVA